MRLLVAATIVAMLVSAASAQDASSLGGGKGGKGRKAPQNTEQQSADKAKQKAADEAFKAALKRIPEPKEKYDPWKIAH
jgi:hypothetical protein